MDEAGFRYYVGVYLFAKGVTSVCVISEVEGGESQVSMLKLAFTFGLHLVSIHSVVV